MFAFFNNKTRSMKNFTNNFYFLFAMLLFSNLNAQTCNSNTLANWSIDECIAGIPHTYVEFDPSTQDSQCGLIYSTIHRAHPTEEVNSNYKHSCVNGRKSGTYGICASGFNQTKFFDEEGCGDGQNYAFRFTVDIPAGKFGTFSNFSFWQKAPEQTPLSNPTNNNYPQKFGLMVTKKSADGSSSVVFRKIDVPTTRDWGLQSFDFSTNHQFNYKPGEQYTFELYAYEPFANGGQMNIWDVTDFSLNGCCSNPVALGNRVFIDNDNSNTFNTGDSTLPNVEIQLFKESQNPSTDSPYLTTTSNAQGFYTFEYLTEGKYKVFIPKQPATNGYGILQTNGSDDGIDNDNNGFEDFGGYVSNLIELISGTEPTNEPSYSNLFTLPDADVDETIDFGFIKLGSISGNVSGEDNINGGMKNLANITIKLYKKDSNNQWILIDTKQTDANGNYKFEDLYSGDYKVEEQDLIQNYDPSKGTDEDEITDAQDDDGFNQPTDNVIFVKLLPSENEAGNNFKEVLSSNLVPVEFTDFSVKKSNQNSYLHWETETENNNKEFIVEFSVDGIQFTQIGCVNGFGTTKEKQSYSFTHYDSIVKKNKKQTLYYRLKQVDYDDSFTYSSIQYIEINEVKSTSMIYPNPTYSAQKISIWNEGIIQSFTIISSQGNIICKKDGIDSNEYILDVSLYPSGTYFIHFQNGISSKFIIQ